MCRSRFNVSCQIFILTHPHSMINRILLVTTFAVSSGVHAACLTASEPLAEPSSALSVKLQTIEVSQNENRRSVASLGTIKNTSDSCFEEAVVEVKYFDSGHNLIDTVVQPMYGLIIPPRSEVAVRVMDAAAKPKKPTPLRRRASLAPSHEFPDKSPSSRCGQRLVICS
jgi:hypothetical protein